MKRTSPREQINQRMKRAGDEFLRAKAQVDSANAEDILRQLPPEQPKPKKKGPRRWPKEIT